MEINSMCKDFKMGKTFQFGKLKESPVVSSYCSGREVEAGVEAGQGVEGEFLQ